MNEGEVLVVGGTSDARAYADNWMRRTSRTPYPWRRQPEKRWLATLKDRCAVVVWNTGRWSPG
ncbi:Uncharacterised protein [Salmonella enterica subsp. enterica]|nr:Uncharacterised protein [Salmonella enterica subsp. enterica]